MPCLSVGKPVIRQTAIQIKLSPVAHIIRFQIQLVKFIHRNSPNTHLIFTISDSFTYSFVLCPVFCIRLQRRKADRHICLLRLHSENLRPAFRSITNHLFLCMSGNQIYFSFLLYQTAVLIFRHIQRIAQTAGPGRLFLRQRNHIPGFPSPLIKRIFTYFLTSIEKVPGAQTA